MIINPYIFGAALDPDAQAYFTANTAITSSADKTAISDFYSGLKTDGIYTKMKAMYLPIWSSATGNKWNLVNPLDTDAAFRLTFSTGWTHSSGGMTPNGTSAYANTFLIPSSVLSLNSTHIASYIRTNLQFSGPIISTENASTYNNGLYIWPWQSQGYYSVRINDDASTFATVTYDIRGLHLATRTGSAVKKYRLNSTQIFSNSVNSSGLNTSSIYIGASRNNANYNGNQQSFISIGTGLTDTEAANFYTRVQTLMTYFGINV